MKNIYSWNVNGIRACTKKGALEWLEVTSPDMLALQETKAEASQLDSSILEPKGYKSYFFSAEKKGYSGVALYTKIEPISVTTLGVDEFDSEGRVLIASFDEFTLLNCYFPNSQEKGARLEYKLSFCDAILKKCDELVSSGKNIVLCGDYNIAHTEIDLKNPKSNQKNPGFLPQERDWMSKFLDSGYRDVFREEHKDEEGHYTWWSYRFNARAKNVGWRIDYTCVNDRLRDGVIKSSIHPEVLGSDHCPVSVRLEL